MALGARVTLSTILVLLATACGGAKPPPQAASTTASAKEPAAVPKPVTALKRSAVKETIAQGLGAFLQNVTVDDWPVMHAGKFHGFKLRAINADWNVDLKPGDIVTRINGIVPERPEEADAALRSLEEAPALKVEFERDGKEKSLELPIID